VVVGVAGVHGLPKGIVVSLNENQHLSLKSSKFLGRLSLERAGSGQWVDKRPCQGHEIDGRDF
jgi:hypothetical protein